MKEITTILLDIDGTLLDFKKAQENALVTVFNAHAIELTDSIRAQYNTINHALWKEYELGLIPRECIFQTRFVKLFEQLNIAVDGVLFEQEYQAMLAEGAFLLDGAMQLVTYLYDHYDLYIVTNGVSSTQHKRLNSSGLSKFMKGIFISEELGCQKPDIEFFTRTFAQIPNIDPSKTMIIGDTLTSDILGGNNANIMTCWYNPEAEKNETSATVDLEIRALNELYQYL